MGSIKKKRRKKMSKHKYDKRMKAQRHNNKYVPRRPGRKAGPFLLVLQRGMAVKKPAGSRPLCGLADRQGRFSCHGPCAASRAHIPVKSLSLYQKFFDLCAPK